MIETELRKVTAETGLFPSCSDLRSLGRNDLAIQVSRHGGFLAWASRLGVCRADSDSDFGWRGEVAVCGLFRAREITAERTERVKSPFDILAGGVLRVDVKTANYAEYKACRGWFYRIGKQPQADLVMFYQYDTGEFYGLPWQLCPTSNVTISRSGGKYADFKNNWTLIDRMIARRVTEREEYAAPLERVA
jgi:hypothetical protein